VEVLSRSHSQSWAGVSAVQLQPHIYYDRTTVREVRLISVKCATVLPLIGVGIVRVAQDEIQRAFPMAIDACLEIR
jgi:hypothetical protein